MKFSARVDPPELSTRTEFPERPALFDAWNRCLARGRERRPIHELEQLLPAIAKPFALTVPADELESRLRFLARWPALRANYHAALRQCLQAKAAEIVLAGLAVQRQAPALLDLNEKVVDQWAEQPKVVEQALMNYAFDDQTDHSATLRWLWTRLPAKQAKARYA